MSKKVAILVDGDFFIRCYKSHLKKQFGDKYEDLNPKKLAHAIHTHCLRHINKENENYTAYFFTIASHQTKRFIIHTLKEL